MAHKIVTLILFSVVAGCFDYLVVTGAPKSSIFVVLFVMVFYMIAAMVAAGLDDDFLEFFFDPLRS